MTDVCWSHDNSHLFSGSSDGLLVEWDVTTATHQRLNFSKTRLTILLHYAICATKFAIAIMKVSDSSQKLPIVAHMKSKTTLTNYSVPDEIC